MAAEREGRARLLLCGYYGEHNLGDDALLAVLLRQLPRGCRPVVTARDQEQVQGRFGVETTDRRRLGTVLGALRRCDGLILGGGSLLQDATSFRSLLYYATLIISARLQGKPVALWAQGLGPLRRRRSRLLARLLLHLANAISFRDQASAALAASWGIRGELGSDPVWGIEPRHWQGAGGPIVVCWRPTAQLDTATWIPYLESLDRLAAAAARPVHWLPFHADQDQHLLRDLAARGLLPESLARRSQAVEAADPAAALDHFQAAGLVLAMRLHGLILAAVAGAPTAALSYDPKVAAAAVALGCPCHDLSAPAPAALESIWSRCLDQPGDAATLAVLRACAERHRLVIDALMTALRRRGRQP